MTRNGKPGAERNRWRPDSILVWTAAEESTLMQCLEAKLTDHKRTSIKALMKYNQVALNSMPTSQFDQPVHAGDTLSVNFTRPFVVFSHPRIKLVYEDNDIIVINKGSGILSVSTDNVKDGTAYSILRDYLKKNTKEDLDSVKMTKNPKFKWDFLYPLLWGNGTFHPILNYSVKGILFYQGCSNVGDPDGQYTKRLADLVAQWRRDFKQGELPFYFVQIAPYHNGDVNGDWGPKLREQQFNAAKVIPNSGIVCTEDLVYPYEVEQIHPCQKQPVGERLALQALSKTYGVKGLFSESMTFKEMKIVGDTVKVHFDNTYGAYNRFEGIEGFEVAGEDKVFHKATAKHFWQEGNDPWNECIIVTSPEVKKPVALRYCFRNFQLGNMANAGNLPLFPFRTDNW